jgi:hypothetical protein
MPILDEDDLRQGLRALSAAPPAALGGLEERSVLRARHIKVRRVATAALTVVALAAPAALVAVRLGDKPPARLAPVASWPDRRDPALHEVASAAFADWARTDALNPGETIRWLYAANVPHTDEIAVAFATCDAERCSRIVIAHADRNAAESDPGDDPDVSPWRERTYPLDDTLPPPVPATYLTPPDGDEDLGPTNVVAVVAPPGGVRVTWTSPARFPGTGGSGELELRDGAFVGDVGYLSDQVTFTVRDRYGRELYTGLVGDPAERGLVPNAPQVPEIELPAGYESHASERGQATARSGLSIQRGVTKKPYTVFVRCRGSAPLVVVADGRRGKAVCDGQVHAVVSDVPVSTDRSEDTRDHMADDVPVDEGDVEIYHESDDPYTTFALAIATRT